MDKSAGFAKVNWSELECTGVYENMNQTIVVIFRPSINYALPNV
jgi:hypothetical protein